MAEILTPDLCVIGAGSSGLGVATAACAWGASVVLIERGRMGGDYLNTGAVPSMALAAAGHQAHAMRSGAQFGISPEEPKVNSRKLNEHVQQVIAGLAPNDSVARLEALGARVIKAEARFIDHRTLTAGDIHVRARRFVIATGARSVAPGIPGLDTVPYFTGETIFDNTRKLTHLVVIGAGPMGLELAQAYNRLGTQVTVVEEGAPLAASDPELAGIALQRMREEGVEIRAGSTVTAILGRSQGIGVVVRSGESDDMLDVSHILVATGRVPDLEALDLDKAGIRRSKDDPRRLALTAGLRTSNRRVYAVGDAAGGARQVHLAGHEAELVVRSILVGLPVRHDHSLIPSVTYTDPEIAEVGLTEPELRRRRGADFRIVRWSFADSDRARATRQSYGIAKMITDRTGRILGAGIVGPGAGELIAIFSFAIANRLSVRHLVNFATPHRTLSDIVRRLGAEYFRDRSANPLLQRLIALIRLLP